MNHKENPKPRSKQDFIQIGNYTVISRGNPTWTLSHKIRYEDNCCFHIEPCCGGLVSKEWIQCQPDWTLRRLVSAQKQIQILISSTCIAHRLCIQTERKSEHLKPFLVKNETTKFGYRNNFPLFLKALPTPFQCWLAQMFTCNQMQFKKNGKVLHTLGFKKASSRIRPAIVSKSMSMEVVNTANQR